MDRKGGT